ncbi:hypothetical protein D3C81_2020990 [compost metagenome]
MAHSCKQTTFADTLGFKLRLQRINFFDELLFTLKRAPNKCDDAIDGKTFHAESEENWIAIFKRTQADICRTCRRTRTQVCKKR